MTRKPDRTIAFEEAVQPAIWSDGNGHYFVYGRHALINQILRWNAIQNAGVGTMAEYFDAKARPFALQVVVPARLHNRICRLIGIPGRPKRELSAEELEMRRSTIQRARASRSRKPASQAGKDLPEPGYSLGA